MLASMSASGRRSLQNPLTGAYYFVPSLSALIARSADG